MEPTDQNPYSVIRKTPIRIITTTTIIMTSGTMKILNIIGKNTTNTSKKSTVKSTVPRKRCPNCGSPVTIRGTHWECTYCGNSGKM